MRNSSKLMLFGILEMCLFVVSILNFKHHPETAMAFMGVVAFMGILFVLIAGAVIHDNTENG